MGCILVNYDKINQKQLSKWRFSNISGYCTLFCYIKENTKEYMPSQQFCSHFSQEGPINLIPSLDCYICIAIFKDTHISYPDPICWPYCPIAILTYDFMASLLVNKGKSYKDVTIWWMNWIDITNRRDHGLNILTKNTHTPIFHFF